MSKQVLLDAIDNIHASLYSWSLYFFQIDRRATNPFKVHKIRFKSNDYIVGYASNAVSAILNYQISPITEVQNYNGENTKVSCDKLALKGDMLKEEWKLLQEAIVNSNDQGIDGKIMGYILEGQTSGEGLENHKSVMFLKVANPIIKLENKKSTVFKVTADKELDLISDDMYRLYLTTDTIVLNGTMYTFNHSFEKMFNLDKTMKKIKNLAIDKILVVDCFANSDEFKEHANAYTSARTFITLNEGRLQKISTDAGRIYVSSALGIELDESNKFINLNENKVGDLIKYLCFKIVKDDESKDLLEVSNAVKYRN